MNSRAGVAKSLGRLACVAALSVCTARTATAAPKMWGPYTYEKVDIADGVYGFVEPKLNAIVSGRGIGLARHSGAGRKSSSLPVAWPVAANSNGWIPALPG